MAPRQPFLPSRDGFAFTNSWPSAPAVSVATPFGAIHLGNAARGLCGGMVFAALDYWYAAVVPPADQPAPGTPAYRFIVRRIIDSWHVPSGVLRYYAWMNRSEAGLSRRTIGQQWPEIRADLDHQIPCALGVVTVASRNPVKLGQNHQVLAYGYDADGSTISLRVYDPNSGPDDTIRISFDSSPSSTGSAFASTLTIAHPVRGFFRTAYRPVSPPAR